MAERVGRGVVGLAAPYSHVAVAMVTTLAYILVVGAIPYQVAPLTVLMFAVLSAAQNSINAWTDIIADRMSWPQRPLAMGTVSRRDAMALSGLLFSAAALTLVGIFAVTLSLIFIAIMAADIFLRITYSAFPLRLKKYPVMSNVIAASFIVLFPFLVTFTLSKSPNLLAVPLVAFLFFETVGSLILEDFVTIEGDKVIGDTTLPILLGRSKASLVALVPFSGAVTVALSSLVAKVSVPWIAASVIPVIQVWRILSLRRSRNNESKVYRAVGALALLSGAILVIGYVQAIT